MLLIEGNMNASAPVLGRSLATFSKLLDQQIPSFPIIQEFRCFSCALTGHSQLTVFSEFSSDTMTRATNCVQQKKKAGVGAHAQPEM